MTVFISGGAKNGKSTYAQRIAKKLAGNGSLYYVATMIPHDEEDNARIRRHLQEREGWGFRTLERGTDILGCLTETGGKGSYLLDSVTALLANEMFRQDGSFDGQSPERVERELVRFAEQAESAVFVSDFIYADAGHYDAYTDAYRKGLAQVDRALAECCDCVLEICSGQVITHKGGNPL